MKIILLILSFSVLALNVFADEKLTVRNTDSGESFEISVPDNLKIYEINSNWLDSVPYLIDHAKWMEPWAYEALGDCYRYGKGGVGKSMAYALAYYNLAGKKMGELLKQTHEENPDDELGIYAYLMIKFFDNPVLDFESLKKELSTINNKDFRWLDLIHKLSAMNKEKFTLSDLEPLLNDNITRDECVFIIGILVNQKIIDKPEKHPIVNKILEKLSCVNSIMAEEYIETYEKNNSDMKPLLQALKNYRLADQQGFLTKDDMKNILYVKEIPGININDYFTAEDIIRFEKLTKRKG